MSEYSEEKKLLGDGVDPSYEATRQDELFPAPLKEGQSGSGNGFLSYLHDHRASIPGYGLVNMVMGSSVYALYVLFALLVAYLLNQLDRYTLPIVTTSAGYDLHYGDLACMKNKSLPEELVQAIEEYKLTDFYKNCTADSVK